MSASRPLIALTTGDPAGVGPELVLRALEDPAISNMVRLVVVGPRTLRPKRIPLAQEADDPSSIEQAWINIADTGTWEMGSVQEPSARAALLALEIGARLASNGFADALVTAPVAKEGLHLAGAKVEGQTELLGRWAGVEAQMLGCADRLRVFLLTRHIPLAQAVREVSTEGVLAALSQLHDGLQGLGFDAPKLALAGLNPHAGEKGLLGGEEGEILEPAVERARKAGLDVHGPLPPDTVFLRAAQGEFDAVLALYHDQAFIPLKLHAPERAFTVLLGLPYLRLSPAHGTAFDIAGQGLAKPDSLFAAIGHAAHWAVERQKASAR